MKHSIASGVLIFMLLAASTGLAAIRCDQLALDRAPRSEEQLLADSVELSRKMIEKVRASEPELAQFQVFDLLSGEFKKILREVDSTLADFRNDPNTYSMSEDIAKIHDAGATIEQKTDAIKKSLAPTRWSRMLKTAHLKKADSTESFIREIQQCRGQAIACAANLREKFGPVTEHIRSVRFLRLRLLEGAKVIERALKNLEEVESAGDGAFTRGSRSMLTQMATLSTLLQGHLDGLATTISSAHVSMESVDGLGLALVAAVQKGAPPAILDLPVPKVTNRSEEEYRSMKTALESAEGTQTVINMLIEDPSPRATEIFVRILQMGRVRMAHKWLVGRSLANTDLQAVRAALSSDSWHAREAAAFLLGRKGDRSDLARLIARLAKEPDSDVQQAIRSSIKALETRPQR